jgi:transposase
VIQLRQSELQRVKVIENAVAGRITLAEAASLLSLGRRQVRRLKQRCVPGEADWVRHGNRGQTRPWRVSQRIRAKVLKLAQGKYAGFNDSHFTEKLQEVEGLELSRESVRRILRGAGRAPPQKRRAPRYRSRRERRPRKGMMVQTDASRERWLEDRGPALTLIGFQDDATSEVLAARFQFECEDTVGYLKVLRAMVEQHGIPLSLYRDRHGASREAGNDFRVLDKTVNRDRLFSLRYERTVGHDHTVSFGARILQVAAAAGQQGYAGKKVEVSHQLNGELHVWLGNEHLHQSQAPLEYSVGMAPKRPVMRRKTAPKKKSPRIYTLGGRAALAVR